MAAEGHLGERAEVPDLDMVGALDQERRLREPHLGGDVEHPGIGESLRVEDHPGGIASRGIRAERAVADTSTGVPCRFWLVVGVIVSSIHVDGSSAMILRASSIYSSTNRSAPGPVSMIRSGRDLRLSIIFRVVLQASKPFHQSNREPRDRAELEESAKAELEVGGRRVRGPPRLHPRHPHIAETVLRPISVEVTPSLGLRPTDGAHFRLGSTPTSSATGGATPSDSGVVVPSSATPSVPSHGRNS